MRFIVGNVEPVPAVVSCRKRSDISGEVEVLVNGVVHLTFSNDGDVVLDNVKETLRVKGVQYEDNGEVKIWREN